MDKTELRKIIRKKADALSEEYIESASRDICKRLFALPEYKAAKSLFIYISVEKEVCTREIISDARSKGKEVFVPVCVSRTEMRAVSLAGAELKENRYGIKEPVFWEKEAAPGEIDLAVVPCVSAGRDKKRLGHGGGYYDRFLSAFHGFSACLCFSKLLSDGIPEEAHDLRPDCVITENDLFA